MAKNSMKPRIRFKGFTDAWEQRKLGEMGETYAGLSSKSKEDFGHGEAEFVPYMNVFTNPIADVAMTEAIEIDDRQAKVKNGDVLFTTSSETPEEVGMSSVWLKNGSNTYLNSFCFGFRASESINSYYLAYMLRSSGVRRKIVFLAQGISRYNISKKKMMEIKVPMPISAEQRQLGEIFRQLDNLITLHQCKDFALDTNKAFQQRCLLSIKSANAWEQRKLGDVGKAQSGIGFPDREQGGKEGVPFYKVSDMNNYGNEHEMHSANNYVTEEQCRRNGWTPITEISVVFAKVGAAIMLNRKRLVRFSFLLDNNTMAYRFGSGWDINFGKTLFERVDLTELVQIGALPSYNATDVESVEISMPDKPEQYQIGEFFKQLDNLITLHQRKQTIKKRSKMDEKRRVNYLMIANAWEQRKLREVFDYERPDTYIVKSDKYSDTYSTPVLTANKGFILGYTNEMQVCNKECIIFDDFTLDSKYVTFPFMVKSSALKILTAKIGYFLPFAYQLLQATNIEILGHARHYISVVQPTKVLIPSNDEQIRIGKCIQQIDNLITLHQRGLIKIQGDKKWQKRKFQKNCSAIILNAG